MGRISSTRIETQAVLENCKHLSLHSTSSATQAVEENRQQVTLDTTTHETNEQSAEQ
ncbi:hypothetical protein HAX54_052013, partial [Datura stramonium]|nr:hypothetical protein [Datura stramonium]